MRVRNDEVDELNLNMPSSSPGRLHTLFDPYVNAGFRHSEDANMDNAVLESTSEGAVDRLSVRRE